MWAEEKEDKLKFKSVCWPYCWLVSHAPIPLFSTATSRVSLSCHYRQASHGCGVAWQRQEKGGGEGRDAFRSVAT